MSAPVLTTINAMGSTSPDGTVFTNKRATLDDPVAVDVHAGLRQVFDYLRLKFDEMFAEMNVRKARAGSYSQAACDIAVASTEAQFCLSEVKLGLIPATIGPYVTAAMGERLARRYFLTAERFDAEPLAGRMNGDPIEVVDALAHRRPAFGRAIPLAARPTHQDVAQAPALPVLAGALHIHPAGGVPVQPEDTQHGPGHHQPVPARRPDDWPAPAAPAGDEQRQPKHPETHPEA
jgi:hypothetical protein